MLLPFVHGPGDLRMCNVETPDVGPGDVLLAVRSAGICGSDLGYVATGGIAGPTVQPVPLGHELSGVVAAVGAHVQSVAVGDRVILNPLLNMIGNGGPEGGFAPHLLVRDVVERPGSLLRIPETISDDEGALIEPLAVAAHAVNRMGVKPADRVAVFGAGPIGLAAIIMLRHRGITDIVAFDLSPLRRERAARLGASATFDPRNHPAADALREIHGAVRVFRADLPATSHYLEATGAPILPEIIAMARSGAHICVVSAQKKPVPVDFSTVLARELEITGALGYPKELDEVIAMLAGGGVSINAYLGAFPIARALAEGADIVITGRVVDSALILGPLIHEFGWGEQDFDLLAAGTAAGHLLECGAQATGGTFTDWRDVPDWANIGFPVAECHADGSFVMTKPDGTGGLVSIGTISEQLLYEVSDPQAYLVPDVSCDFAFARLEQVGPDRIRVTGIRGYPPTADYKVCVTFDDGWRATAIQPIIGIEAPAKARRQADAILERMTRMLSDAGLPPLRRSHVEIIGTEAGYGPNARPLAPREVICRIVIDADDRRAADIFWREQNSAIMNMAVGTTIGLGIAMPRCWPILGLFSFLIPKAAVQARLSFEDREIPCGPALIGDFRPAQIERAKDGEISASASAGHNLPLLALAWVRSGEKGDLFNVAVVARRPEYLPFIRAALTTETVGARYRHLLGVPEHPQVTCYEVPGLHALNFVIEDAQAGGINSSPRLDPAAKSMGQHLLEEPVQVPKALVNAVDRARADAIL